MTQQDINRLSVINKTIDSILTIREAAELLNLSERQIIRLKKGVLEQGPAFVIHSKQVNLTQFGRAMDELGVSKIN